MYPHRGHKIRMCVAVHSLSEVGANPSNLHCNALSGSPSSSRSSSSGWIAKLGLPFLNRACPDLDVYTQPPGGDK